MKNPQQKKIVTDAFWDVIHSKLPILPNTNMNSIVNVETDMQRETRLGHSQLMQEKFPNEQKVCFSINVGGLSSSGKVGREGEGECESLLASKNSQGFIVNVYQTENHELVKTDEELKQPGSINIQVKLQIHLPQTILDSASCPIFDQFQFGKPERYAKFSPPKSGEAKTDAIFSAKECVVPSDTNHQREQTAGIEREKTVTFGSCMSAFSISKRKRNFKQYSDIKTLVRPKCGILKAKKPSISYILNIKGGASPKHRKELGCNLTTKMEAVDQGKEMADKMSSFMTIAPDMNMHSKIEKDMLRKKRLSSKQVKQALSLHEENITSDDTKETSLQGEEEGESEQDTLLKGVPEQGNYFIFCSGQKEELDLHKSEKEGSGRILFVTEQAVPPQMQPTDPMQAEEPKKSHQTQNGTICTAKSKLPLIKSKESLRDQVFIDPMGDGIPSNGSHPGELYSHGKEEEPEFNKNQQATVLQSLAVSIPDPPESKRQRKTFTCTTLKCKMSSKCVTRKARKTPISQMFDIPGKGCQKNLPSKILKSRIFDFLVDVNYSEVLEDLTAERKEGLAQVLPATMPESLALSTLALPTSKRKYLTCSGKRNKMSPKCVTLKAKNALISQTFNITKRGPPSHRRPFECNFKVMMGKYIPVADIIRNAISSALPISFDMNVNNRIKVEIDEPWKMRFSHELQQQEQSPDGEQACCASSSDKRGSASNSMKKAKTPGGGVAPWNTQHFSFNAPKMTEPLFVYPDVERMNSARKKVPEFLTTAQELQQQTLFTQRVLHPIPRSILNVLPFEKSPKNTQTYTGLKDTRSPKILSPMPGKSVGESLKDAAQSGIPLGKSPRKELAGSIPEREIRLQKDLPARNLEFSYFSVPASSDFKGQRNAAQIPKSRSRKAKMVSKTINITRSGALSHGKQQDPILENMAQQRSLGRSYMFINSFLSSTPVSPAIKNHKKEKSKKGPLRKKSSIIWGWEQGEGERDNGERLSTYSYNKWSTFKNILESIWQNEKNKQDNEILSKAGLPLLSSMGHKKDQNMLIAEQEVQQQTLCSKNTSEIVCSPQMIPFQTEKLQKNMPPQKDTLHRIGEGISCPKSETAGFDYLLIDGTEYSMTSGGSPTKKLDVHRAGSLHSKEEKEDIATQKVINHTVDKNIPPTKSGDSVLGDPCDESSRRQMGGHIAKKYEDLQRDLLTRSTMSVLSESQRQKEVFKFSEGKNLTGPISVTMKTQKPPCSQTLTVTEHGTLYCRKEQECNSKSTIKDMQQNKSIDNAFSSPIALSTDDKTDIEMYRTLKAEMDQQRVRFKNSVYLKLEKSTCYREAHLQKANPADTQNNRSGYTVEMNVQQNKEEVAVETINLMLPKNKEEKMQGSKDGPGVLMTQTSNPLPSLSLLKWNKEMQRISYAGEMVRTEPISGDIPENVQNKKQYMRQEEETYREKTVAMRGMTHAADISMKSKESSSYTLHRTELLMNIGSQGQKIHERQGISPCTVLRKVLISKPPTDLKLDKGTQVEEEELGIKIPILFPQMVSALSDTEKTEDTETIGGDVRKTKHLSPKEKDREQNRTKVDQDLLEITGSSFSQLQLPESSGAGNNNYANFNEHISSCNTIIEANQLMPHTDTKDRVKTEDEKGKKLPQIMTLRKQTSPPTHLLSKKRQPLNIKQKVEDTQKDKGKPDMVLRKACASSPSPFHLKWDTRMKEQEDTLRTTQPCFPLLNIKHSSYSGKKAYATSLEGYMLKKDDRLKRDIEDKMLPMYMDLKAKKLPLSTYSCNKWTTSKSILESKWQKEKHIQDTEILFKARLPFLNSMQCRKDQNMLIAKREVQQQILVSESITESVSSPLTIPFQTEKLQKNMPPIKYILQKLGEIISCPKSGKVKFDYLLADGTGYNTSSGGSPTRKLDVHRAGSLHSNEEKKHTVAQKVIKDTVDQNIPPTKSGYSMLGDPCDESSRRKMGGHIAKKYEDLQRDLLTRSTMSVLSESKVKKEVFKFPERKNLTGPISVTMKTQKPPCSQTLTVTEHGTLYCRKEQECNSKSTIKDMQQNKSIDNAFSSPIALSTDDKTDIEMYRTLKAEMDQQRVRFKNSVYLKLEKSTCYREAHLQKANPADTQNNRSGYTMEMNVQQNKEEVAVETINLMLPKNKEEKMQGSKDGPGVLMTQSSNSLQSLSLLKWNKEMQRITYTGEIVHIEPISGDIPENVQNKKQHMHQEEETNREKTVAMRGMTHAADISMKSKESPSSDTLQRTELHMNVGSQGRKVHEGQGRSPCTVLRKVLISKPPTDLKLDKGTQVEEEELGIKRPILFPQMVSALSDAEKTEDTETIGGDVRKTKHLSLKEKNREQNRTKVDQDLLEITGFSFSQLQLPESSGAGNNNYANFNEHISSCNTIVEANQHMSYTDIMDRVKIEEGKGRLLPQIMTLRIQTSPPTHLLSKKRQPLNIKQKVEDTQKDKGKSDMVLRKACASSPSPFHLKWDTRMNEQEDILGTTQPCFPPLKIQHSSYSGKNAYAMSFQGYKLKKDDRLKRDIEDKVRPMYTDLKAKKSPPPHILQRTELQNTKELRCEIKEQKRKVQEDKNKLVTNIKNICASLVTLPYLKFEATEREGCMIIIAKEPLPQPQSKESSHAEAIDGELSTDVKELKELMLQKEAKTREKTMDMNSIVDPIDMYLKRKKSPILLIYNLSDLQRKTKEQKGKVQKVEPTGVMLTKTCTSSFPPVHLNMNIRIREKSISPLTRSSVSPVHFQGSSSAEKVVYIEPIIPDILIRPQEGKQCVPQNKEEVGVETINLAFPTHQEKKTQESKECGFNKPKEIALRNEDDSGVLIRSLFISGMNLSQTEEVVESETKQERKKRICFSKFQEKSLTASEIVERDNSSTVKRGGQNFPSIVPEDSQPSTVDQRQMQKPPSVKPEENLSSEVNKINVTLQTEGGVVSEHDSSRVIKEPDLLTIEQEEKAPKPILTPTECPSMSEDPKGNVKIHMKSTLRVEGHEHRDQSEPVQDTTTQKVQQPNTCSGTVPTLPQVESNEIKIVADSTSRESLLPFYDAIKNVFEFQVKNMIQDKVCTDKLDEVKARCPDDWKSTPFSEGPDITSTTEHPTFQPKPIVESKALEIKLNLIPKMAKQSFQKSNFYSKQTISEDNSRRLYPRHKKMSFLSLEGIDTITLNLKHKSQKDSPQISCMKTLTVVSSGSKEIMTKVKSISKPESGTSSVTSANKMPMSRILQNYSEEEKDKLLIHFSMKTLETQMKAFPKIVTESYSMADTQARKKPLSKCIYSGVKVPKQKNIISLGFEEKSLHQIELDLQSKYLRFLLGLPVESMTPKPSTLPKHILKLNTAATCKKVDDNGESGSLSIDTELLEQHISFKMQSPHENSSLVRRFPEPTHVCASDPEQHGTAQEDTMILSVLKPHLTPEKDRHHVWFQETASLADYHSIQAFQDFTDRQTDIENSANLEKCSALEKHENEQSTLLEANPYLSQESENMLYELQTSIPLENLYKMKQIQTDLKPLYSDNSVSHPVGGCRKPSSAATTPSYESHSTRKYRAPPTVQSPHWLCHSSLNTVEGPFASPTKLSEEKLLWITESSLAPLTESNLKLHLAKSQAKPHRHLERKKSNLDSCRNNVHWDCYPNYTQSKAKRTREKKVRDCEPERAGSFLSKRKSASKPHQEDFNFHYEGKQNQPFFYACVPADSLEIIPQTIRWTIPQKTLRKRNFKVPLVAKISSSFHMWSFSKKLGRHS
ncbi:leucine-rich repeat transmembrane protein CCDC168-like [Myotis daubentonii]|uniref:leucine-rich repeat transmembrane protein CCDC168-like n=1 Tax=Myotis daubentonii TaxID=98922 RepID=UPI0028733419|nr:leucine-rich repeat transmembrane protein CCDC168-like [Myotis daubentonii]